MNSWQFQQKPEVVARIEVINLIVETIRILRERWIDKKSKEQFSLALHFLDVLMSPYKQDPIFVENYKNLLETYAPIEESLREQLNVKKNLTEKQLKELSIEFQLEYFRLLWDLAVRSIFVGKEIDVDIDLNEVFKEYEKINEVWKDAETGNAGSDKKKG